jgi:hypothetical protein
VEGGGGGFLHLVGLAPFIESLCKIWKRWHKKENHAVEKRQKKNIGKKRRPIKILKRYYLAPTVIHKG